MKCVIFDIDGTIADCSERLHFMQGEKKEWDKFHKECINDKPIRITIELLSLMYIVREYELIFLTTRPESSRDLTSEWIEKHIPIIRNDYQLIMREDRDHRPDNIVKLENLEKEGLTPDKVRFIVEDRNRNVVAMRSAGYTVLQPDEGDY